MYLYIGILAASLPTIANADPVLTPTVGLSFETPYGSNVTVDEERGGKAAVAAELIKLGGKLIIDEHKGTKVHFWEYRGNYIIESECWEDGSGPCANGNCLDHDGRRGVKIQEISIKCAWFCFHRTHCRLQTCCPFTNKRPHTAGGNPTTGIYKKMNYSNFCSGPWARITSEATCHAAAAALGLKWAQSSDGPGDFPGCLHTKDQRNSVYFNTSPNPSNNPNVNVNYAEICQAGPYKKMDYSNFCSGPWARITSEATCRAAAAALDLKWAQSWDGPGDFPGCLHTKDQRNSVYFNTSPNPSNNPNVNVNYAEICRTKAQAACKTEDGVFIARGNNVKAFRSRGQSHCSSACASTHGCVGWTMRTSDNYCWLKSNDSRKGKSAGWITGKKC